MSPRIAEHMTWHQSHDAIDGVMVYPSNGEAWKHFNSVHPLFQLNHGTYVLHCIQMDSTHSGHLLLLILVGRSYSWFITCHRDVYEAGVHVFIYGHTRSEQFGPKYKCLSLTVDWWVDVVVVIQSFDLWYIEETKFCYEGGIDVDYQ
jgi:hypothetical protein